MSSENWGDLEARSGSFFPTCCALLAETRQAVVTKRLMYIKERILQCGLSEDTQLQNVGMQ